jgi:hypothetical protein
MLCNKIYLTCSSAVSASASNSRGTLEEIRFNNVFNTKVMELQIWRSVTLMMHVFAKYSTTVNVHVELKKSIDNE